MKICPECGTPCNDETLFCYICGSKFHVNNLRLNSGYASEYYAIDSDTSESVLEYPAIFLTDKDITGIYDILPLLEEAARSACPLVIIASSFGRDVINTIVLNNMRGTLKCVAVTAPEQGKNRKDILGDVAVLTGGSVISSDSGIELTDTTLSLCGRAKSVSITKDETVIIGGNGNESSIKQRVSQLKQFLSVTESGCNRSFIQNRLLTLFGLTESETGLS